MKYGRLITGNLKARRPIFVARLWMGYLGWWANFNLSQMPGAIPQWIMVLLAKLPPRGYSLVSGGWDGKLRVYGPGAIGNGNETFLEAHFSRLWVEALGPIPKRLGVLLSGKYAKHCHRCDWTDFDDGLLYGGSGVAMENAFDEFIGSISPTEKQLSEAVAAVDEVVVRLAQDGHEIN